MMWKNISLILFSTVLTLIFGELVLRAFDLPPYPEHFAAGIYQNDVENGFVFAPNSKDSDSSYEYKTVIEINDIGLRDYNTISYKTVPYAFAIGDSFVEGFGMDLEESIPKVLEKKIGKPVVNLGIGSYGTRQEMVLYARYLSRFVEKPKFALLFFYVGNDYHDNAQLATGPIHRVERGYRIHRAEGAVDKVTVSGNIIRFLNKQGEVLREVRDFEFHPQTRVGMPLLEQTKIYNIIANSLPPKPNNMQNCTLPVAIPGLFDKKYNWDKSLEWVETKKSMRKFISISRDAGVIPFVVIIPSKYQTMPNLLYKLKQCDTDNLDIHTSINIMRDYLAKEEVDFVDILEEMDKTISVDARQKLWNVVDTHFNPEGARFVAKSVDKYINEKLLHSNITK